MSWSFYALNVKDSGDESDVEEELTDVVEAHENFKSQFVTGDEVHDIAVREQLDLAVKLVATAITDGAVGSSDQGFSVSMSGHANPEHMPTPGMANDFIQINVSQR